MVEPKEKCDSIGRFKGETGEGINYPCKLEKGHTQKHMCFGGDLLAWAYGKSAYWEIRWCDCVEWCDCE